MYKNYFKFFFEFILSCLCILLSIPIFILTSLFIILESGLPIIHWSKRIGKKSKIFMMPKFRSMKVGSPNIASNQLRKPKKHITRAGFYIRKLSIDELPQLFLVLSGKMSIVGPRPALYNQFYLIKLRKIKKIDSILPGITGLAQVNGRDKLSIREKVKFDEVYCKNINFFFDFKIIIKTIFNIIINK